MFAVNNLTAEFSCCYSFIFFLSRSHIQQVTLNIGKTMKRKAKKKTWISCLQTNVDYLILFTGCRSFTFCDIFYLESKISLTLPVKVTWYFLLEKFSNRPTVNKIAQLAKIELNIERRWSPLLGKNYIIIFLVFVKLKNIDVLKKYKISNFRLKILNFFLLVVRFVNKVYKWKIKNRLLFIYIFF